MAVGLQRGKRGLAPDGSAPLRHFRLCRPEFPGPVVGHRRLKIRIFEFLDEPRQKREGTSA